ncbi:hypothetical protein PGH26_06695 [Sporosarcina jeotgali]|uniref:Uncharacterized protein n=1 Tax=Sporosarcina jeotgali TaxID=3020056 RepID=A0ABZ0L131_9BACL|nr:hypothetical protein [Sporosarcina sp. B2O-1]WOV85618.1 hypothetical protein PGH26_06695 [Sporosarcina sp. B2O-1]
MGKENIKLFGIPIVFLLLGILFLILGANGDSIAVNFSRPPGATSWTTSGSTADAFTSVLMIIGISFQILFISTFSISFYLWQKGSR